MRLCARARSTGRGSDEIFEHIADYLGLDGDIGSIEPGKLADLAVIEGNPLEDIRVSEKVRYTVINGRVYDSSTMDETVTGERKRKPFYWQKGR